jgi:hypothetical protein
MTATKLLGTLVLAGTLVGCTAGAPTDGSLRLGSDGSFHPDATASISNYTGHGDSGEGWAGDSEGEGGPSAELPTTKDRIAP